MPDEEVLCLTRSGLEWGDEGNEEAATQPHDQAATHSHKTTSLTRPQTFRQWLSGLLIVFNVFLNVILLLI